MRITALIVTITAFCIYATPEETSLDVQFFKKSHATLAKKQLDINIDYFQKLSEWALKLRGDTIATGKQLLKKKQRDEALTGEELENLQRGIIEHLTLRELMLELVESTRGALEDNCPGCNFGSSIATREKKYLMGVAGAVTLYDNFALSISVFKDDSFLRRIINRGDSGFKVEEDRLEEVMDSYYSVLKRREMRSALKWYEKNKKKFSKLAKKDKDIGYFMDLIDGSPSVAQISDSYVLADLASYIKLFTVKGEDTVAESADLISNEVSKLFGNSVGMIQVRSGILKNDKKTIEKIKNELKPLDVLLEKTPFRLTDKLIPGYFGHVAIWVGTEKELVELGLWNHPIIKPHQAEIRAGKSVLEALRSGVELNTLEHFMDIDDMATLRCNKLSDDTTSETIIRCFRQVGKDYDFNFDVETADKIVCSELVYQTFTNLKWPTEKVLGRVTISPDNVALKAYPDGDFNLVSFYQNGKAVKQDKLLEKFKACLEEDD